MNHPAQELCVMIGGSWLYNPRNLRSADRSRNSPAYRGNYLGFRLALLDTKPHVLRGGSWFNNPRYSRSAQRNYYSPSYRYYGIGFRLALEGTP